MWIKKHPTKQWPLSDAKIVGLTLIVTMARLGATDYSWTTTNQMISVPTES